MHRLHNYALTFALACLIILLNGCRTDDNGYTIPEDVNYSGTGSVTQGIGTATNRNIYPQGTRNAPLGIITSLRFQNWTVPADVEFSNRQFPTASDLYHPDDAPNSNTQQALDKLRDDDIITVDEGGEVITGFILTDNYFELYVNGVQVGKDAIPYTPFNSHIVQFRVNRPFTLAMSLVDWEENLGLGSEENGGTRYQPGDGGMVAYFQDSTGAFVAKSDAAWHAQVYYISPIQDLECPSEQGSVRNTSACSTEGTDQGAGFYGLHWNVPENWETEGFDDSDWPSAIEFSNATVGLESDPAYANFTDVFDNGAHDARFIWTSNLVLDNWVLVRYTVN
ncbi:hypothetical protein [Pontibacter sp. G13]|uniref:hypothetical protein n=1 Tax=Pontibacter sp. G13 TaxID=3074898 RepID=UPI002889BDA3|nr:hypothetical protein [Pontibacter sp. G13]WNJ17632.1 hypothetical protein RJD25_22505 [Pontibacter sp. G13]